MKKLILSLILLNSFLTYICAQVWEGRNADFPKSNFGDKVYAIDDSVAWNLGIEIDSIGYLTFDNNAMSKSTDGGLTWANVVYPTQALNYPACILALDDQTAWFTCIEYPNAVDTERKIYNTTNGGQHWNIVNTPDSVYVDFIYMWDVSEGIIIGGPEVDGFTIYMTVDGGVTWERNQHILTLLNGEYFWPDDDNYAVIGDQLWFATTKGRIFHTTDKGITWEAWNTPFAGFDAWNMNVSDNGDVYQSFYNYIGPTQGADCFLYRRNASDGQWVNITESYHNYFLYDIKPIPGSNVIMSIINDWIGEGLQTKISYDKGATWTVIDNETGATYFDFYNPEVGYASQFNLGSDLTPTLVYRYVGSPLTGLIKQIPILNAEISISPNPTSDIVNINLNSDSPEDYWILLNSISGDLIDKKVFTNVSGFSHSLDLTPLPQSVYFITVANSQGVKTEKLVRQ